MENVIVIADDIKVVEMTTTCYIREVEARLIRELLNLEHRLVIRLGAIIVSAIVATAVLL